MRGLTEHEVRALAEAEYEISKEDAEALIRRGVLSVAAKDDRWVYYQATPAGELSLRLAAAAKGWTP